MPNFIKHLQIRSKCGKMMILRVEKVAFAAFLILLEKAPLMREGGLRLIKQPVVMAVLRPFLQEVPK